MIITSIKKFDGHEMNETTMFRNLNKYPAKFLRLQCASKEGKRWKRIKYCEHADL